MREREARPREEGRRTQWFGPRRAGWYSKGSVPKREEGRAQREERREKREERDKHYEDERVEGGNGSIPEWRDGTEKGRSLGRKREESRGKIEPRAGKVRGSRGATDRSQNGGMVQKRVGP